MVTSVTSTTDTTAAAAAMKKSIGMNKDDFMKLLVAQLKYQDPLKPQDATAMLDQLSQLTLVEQSYNTNTALQNLLTSQNNSATMSSVSFIGKDVKANGNAIPFDGTSAASMQFNLSAAVDSAQIDISDSNGNVVRTISATALNQGDSSVSWDGRDSNGNLLSAGAYTFSVKGTTADGSTVIATTYTAGRIDGVSLVDGTPLLTIGAATISLSDVISVKGV